MELMTREVAQPLRMNLRPQARTPDYPGLLQAIRLKTQDGRLGMLSVQSPGISLIYLLY